MRIYQHKNINIPKSELSKQLFKNLSLFYKPLLEQIKPYKLGENRRKLDIGGQYARRILLQFGSIKEPQSIRLLVDFLVEGCPDHGYVIDYDLLKLFLPTGVEMSNTWGADYSSQLTNLSFTLIERDEPPNYMGFVEQIPTTDVVDEKASQNVDGTNISLEKVGVKLNGKKDKNIPNEAK